jgi:LEA14-like dessication related protein
MLRTLLIGSVLLFACEQVKAPEIKADGVGPPKITPQGASMEATLSVFNPNKSALTANGIESKVTIGGKPNVARAVVTEALVLPGEQRTTVKMPIQVEWTDHAAVAELAKAKQNAPYVVEGMVHYAGKSDTVQTPFRVEGTMTADELAKASN